MKHKHQHQSAYTGFAGTLHTMDCECSKCHTLATVEPLRFDWSAMLLVVLVFVVASAVFQ